jgi:hypothetical protein
LYCFTHPWNLPLNVIRIDTRTGRRQPWLRLLPPDMAGVNVRTTNPTALTADGRYYGYSYNRLLSDLYVVTGVR